MEISAGPPAAPGAAPFEPHGGLNPEAYRHYVENELVRWTPIVRTMGLKID
jgi:hypothetical protein